MTTYQDHLDREAERNAAEQREQRSEEMNAGLDEATIQAVKEWNRDSTAQTDDTSTLPG